MNKGSYADNTALYSYGKLSRLNRRRKAINTALIVLVFLLAILVAFPLYWMVRCSLVSKSALTVPEYFADPPGIFPKVIQWVNYTLGMERINFFQQLLNSLIITIPYVLGNLLTTSVSAYAFARIRFPLRGMWFALVISTMMLPCAVTLLPQYAMYTKMGLVGTDAILGGRLPLILPALFCASGNAYFVFLLRQFMMTIPVEIDEAARIDGAGHIRIFINIMLPLIRPALIVVGLFSFINCWNEFFYSIIYLQGEKVYTLTLGLYIINGVHITNYEQVMALAVLVSAPCLLLFLIGNKYFVEGIKLSGIKG
ncbi:MAG: carbohydrate ABC transporter permease [Christensenellales bacterium]